MDKIDAFLAAGDSPTSPSVVPAAQQASDEPAGLNEFIAPELKEEKYGSIGQQALTAAEGAGESATFGLSAGAERLLSKMGVPGIAPEDVLARRQVNPVSHVAGQIGGLVASGLLAPELGAASLMGRAGALTAEAANVGRIGTAAVKDAIETALFESGNQVSKMLLSDPDQSIGSAAASVGLSGLLGGVIGTGLGSVNPLWKAANESKLGQFAQDFIARGQEKMGVAAPEIGAETEGAVYDPFLKEHTLPSGSAPAEIELEKAPEKLSSGAKAFDALVEKGMKKFGGKAIGAAVGGALGHTVGLGWLGAMLGEHTLGPMFDGVLPAISKTMLEMAPSGAGLKAAVDYGVAVTRGESLVSGLASKVFKAGADVLPTKLVPDSKDTEKLDKILKTKDDNPENMFAVGNDLQHYMMPHALELASLTDHATAYLNQLRPVATKTLPLDTESKISALAKANFDNALRIAEQPLGVFSKIKDGSVTKDDVTHLGSLYPGLYKLMSQKLFDSMIVHTAKGNDVPYNTRMGLSLFLGQPLDSTMTPSAIQAAQFRMPQQQSQQTSSRQQSHSNKTGKIGLMTATPGQTRQMARATRF